MTRRAFGTRGNLANQLFRCLETPYSDVLEHNTVPATKSPGQRIFRWLGFVCDRPKSVSNPYLLQGLARFFGCAALAAHRCTHHRGDLGAHLASECSTTSLCGSGFLDGLLRHRHQGRRTGRQAVGMVSQMWSLLRPSTTARCYGKTSSEAKGSRPYRRYGCQSPWSAI